MDSTHDDTNTPTAEAADDASKQQFLDALFAAGHESVPSANDREPIDSDGVALSSNPDPMDLPGAPAGPVSARSQPAISPNKPEIMYSIKKGSDNDESTDPVVDQTGTETVTDEKTANPDADLLLLSCPKCGGQLALRQEHIGIEGACVWCEAPIVAGRAGADRAVKVFAIATETEAETEAPAAAPAESKVEEKQATPAEVPAEISQPEEPTGFAEGNMATGWGAPATKDEAPEVPSEFSPAKEEDEEAKSAPVEVSDEATGIAESDMPMGWGAPAPKDEVAEADAEFSPADFKSPAEASEESAPAEQDEPAPSAGFATGFDAPSESATEEDVFADFSTAPSSADEDEPSEPSPHGSGFGEFLSAASGSAQEASAPEQTPVEEGFSSPTPWGPPAQRAAEALDSAPVGEASDSPPAEEPTSVEADSAPATDFAAPVEWNAPKPTRPAAAEDEAPSPSSGFGSPAVDAEPPTLFSSNPSESTDAPPAEPEALFSATSPSRPESAGSDDEFPVGFNIPSGEPSSSPFPSFGPTDAPPAPLEEKTQPELSTDESLPVFEANEESMFSPAGPATDTASLFGAPNKETSSLFAPAPEAAPAEKAPANPFGEDTVPKESTTAEEISPAPDQEQPDSAAPAPATPKVDSVSLGKKKRGKGFFIITAVILGLVCGAALASFVLPMDEYVSRARSIMEQKFMPSATWESAENSAPMEQPSDPSPQLSN